LIDHVLSALKDGKLHYFGQLLTDTGLSPRKLGLIINFLEQFHFVKIKKGPQSTFWVQINGGVKQFLENIEAAEGDLQGDRVASPVP
jgi:hypothetical protein